MKKYYEIIKELREDSEPKKSQTEVGKECGISQRKLSFIESGITEPKLKDLVALCKYFNVSADYILGLPENMPYPKR